DARDPGGIDFFAQRVMDDPQPSNDLYDPAHDDKTVLTQNQQQEGAPGHQAGAPAPWQQPPQTHLTDRHLRRIGFQDKLPPPEEERDGPPTPKKGDGPETQGPKDPHAPKDPRGPKTDAGTLLEGPRGNVIIEALPELGAIVVRANTPADVEAVMRIIEYIQEQYREAAEMSIELVQLEGADATAGGGFPAAELPRGAVHRSGPLRARAPPAPRGRV